MRITVKNIEKNYDMPVLKQISHVFEGGKLYVIKGVSGCGKTTFLNIIGGIEEEFGGEIYIDDKKCESSDMIRDMTGYVFQNSLLLSNITVMENLLLIRNDSEFVMELCKDFGVEDLKDKYPSELSGGERQRIALVRAMLVNPMLLIADEPTASLDEENSVNTAEVIAGLKKQGRVVIVATHEHYFDEHADEIIYLEYGEIEKTVTNNVKTDGRTVVDTRSEAESKCKNMSALKYCAKRDRKLFKPITLLPFVLSFMLIMIVSTIQNNFESEYMKLITEHYPTDSFSIFESDLNSFTYKDELKIYDYYTFEEDGVTAFYLADQKDSVLSIDGMLMYGAFPDKPEEIIVSYEFIRDEFKNETNMENIVGEKYLFMDKEFIISGILYSSDMKISQEGRNEDFSSHYNNDVYYRRYEGSIIYIPYDTIQTLGDKSVKEYSDLVILNASYHDLFEHGDVMKELNMIKGGSSVNEYYSKVEASQSALDGMVIILTVVFIVCFVISCIFMSSQIQIELFYRRKELGFLQLFGLSKKRVKELVFTGYIIKLSVAFVIAVAAYVLCIGVYFAVTGHFVFMNMLHVLAVITVICLFYCMTVMLTMGKFLKKAIIELIV